MFKKLATLFILAERMVGVSFASADSHILDECINAAQEYKSAVSDIKSDFNFVSNCAPLASKNQKNNHHLHKKVLDKGLNYYANMNYIVIENEFTSDIRTIAGSKTKLQHIENISLSPSGNELAVFNKKLNGTNNILIFSTQITGNIVPLKVIEINIPSKDEISEIMFGEDNQIFLFNKSINSFIKVSALSDSRSPTPKKRPNFKNIGILDYDQNEIKAISILKDNILILMSSSVELHSSKDLSKNGRIELLESEQSVQNRIITNENDLTFSLIKDNSEEILFQLK